MRRLPDPAARRVSQPELCVNGEKTSKQTKMQFILANRKGRTEGYVSRWLGDREHVVLCYALVISWLLLFHKHDWAELWLQLLQLPCLPDTIVNWVSRYKGKTIIVNICATNFSFKNMAKLKKKFAVLGTTYVLTHWIPNCKSWSTSQFS